VRPSRAVRAGAVIARGFARRVKDDSRIDFEMSNATGTASIFASGPKIGFCSLLNGQTKTITLTCESCERISSGARTKIDISAGEADPDEDEDYGGSALLGSGYQRPQGLF
jgi:hypothetical protein